MTNTNWDASLNTRHISSNLETYEAARSAFFVLTVSELDNLLNPNYTGEIDEAGSTDYIQNAQEILKLNVVKAPVPSLSVATEEFRRGNDVVRFAGLPTWDNGGTMEVDDIVGQHTKDLLYAWLYLAYNPHTRKGGRMKDYKKTATLYEYTQDYELIRTWTIEGMFITKITEDEFDRTADGKRQLHVEFSYDRATFETEANSK